MKRKASLLQGKSIEQWQKEIPLLRKITAKEPLTYLHPLPAPWEEVKDALPLTYAHIVEAEERLARFRPYLELCFPSLKETQGLIESPLREIPTMKAFLEETHKERLPGKLYLKMDSHLPISGSIKARGGIYEVLCHAEHLAKEAGLLSPDTNYKVLLEKPARELFSKHTLEVGSTGNLGLSIGIMAKAMGFQVKVHMSNDARPWKIALLQAKGAEVLTYPEDYEKAVAAGREASKKNPSSYFIDDENSPRLFLGYAVAALRLKKQFEEEGILVDEAHPLFVHLPCGVGGGPGGITFGLKSLFGDHVHCFFAEPTEAPAVVLGLMTGLLAKASAKDFGCSLHTAADGLAVGRPSPLVMKFMEPLLSGGYTVPDEVLFHHLVALLDTQGILLEPSALAGFPGPYNLLRHGYYKEHFSPLAMKNATHILWATGGSMVPTEEMDQYLQKGKSLLERNLDE